MKSLQSSTRFCGIGIKGRLFIVYAKDAKTAKLLFLNGRTLSLKGLVPIEVDPETVWEYRQPEWEPEGIVYGYHKNVALP